MLVLKQMRWRQKRHRAFLNEPTPEEARVLSNRCEPPLVRNYPFTMPTLLKEKSLREIGSRGSGTLVLG